MGEWRWEKENKKCCIATFNFQLKKGFRPFFNTIVYCSESDFFVPTSNPAGYWHWH